MTAILEKIAFYGTYPFVRYALIVGVLIALCSSLLGVTLVLRRFSFIGDGLAHVAFGAMSIAAVLKLTDDMPLTLGVTVVCAVLLLRTAELLGLEPGQPGTPPEDEAQAAPWAREAVRWVCSAGLMETEQGRFRPEEGLTRQEGEAAVARLSALAG